MPHRFRHARKSGFRPWPALLLTLVAFSGTGLAATELPSLGKDSAFNIERETQLGRSVYERLLASGLIETNPILDRYINDLGYRLLAGIPNRSRGYVFFIIRDDAVNAFALPGGFIGINRGLIYSAETQHQLASVVAHEIAHVELTHGLDMMEKSSQVGGAALATFLAGLLLGTVDSQVGAAVMFGGAAGAQQSIVNFTRENEYEADRVGMQLMSDANFDTNGTVEFFTIMAKLSGSSELGDIEYLRTHPVGSNRIAEAIGRVRNSPQSGDQVEDYGLFKDYLRYVSSDHLPPQGSGFLRALSAMKAGDYSRADPLLEALYREDDENSFYGLAYAENLEHQRRGEDAEKVYRRLLAIYPGDYVLSMRQANLLNRLGRPSEALQIVRRLEIEYPEKQQVYFALSNIYQALGRPVPQMMAEAEFHRLNGNSRQSIRLYDQVIASAEADPTTVSKAQEKRLLLLEE